MRGRVLSLMILVLMAAPTFAAENDEADNELSTPTEQSEGANCMKMCMKENNDFYDCQESCVEVVSVKPLWFVAKR